MVFYHWAPMFSTIPERDGLPIRQWSPDLPSHDVLLSRAVIFYHPGNDFLASAIGQLRAHARGWIRT